MGQVSTVKTEKKGTHQVDVMAAAFVVIANAVSGDGRQRAPATAEWAPRTDASDTSLRGEGGRGDYVQRRGRDSGCEPVEEDERQPLYTRAATVMSKIRV